jgi:hypothetical protein
VRLLALDIYASASATTVAASELPPHGKLLYAMADHLPDVAQSRQMNPQNTLDIKGKSIELTAGAGQPGQPVSAEVQVSGISDFVAVMRIAATSHKPQLMFRFHRGPDGDHVVAIPAYLHLGPAAPGARAIDAHSCCQDLDVFTAPLGTGPTLYRAPQLLSVPASMGEELLVVVSVKGPLLVVHEGGQEIARVVFDSARPGGMLLQVQARGRVVPATLSLKSFEIYEAAPAR